MWGRRVVHDAIEMPCTSSARGATCRSSRSRRRRAAHARRLALVARRSLPGHSKTLALFEHEYTLDSSRGVAGPQPQRDLVPAQLLPAAAARRDPQDRLRDWSIEHWSKVLDFEGTPIWIAPDFGFWTTRAASR